MSNFTFRLDLAPNLYSPETAAALGATLMPFQQASNGQVVAIWFAAQPGDRCSVPPDHLRFAARSGDQLPALTYEFAAPVCPGVADAIVRLQRDQTFRRHLVHGVTKKKSKTYVLVARDCVSACNFDPAGGVIGVQF